MPAEIVGEDLTPLHFVLETKPQIFDKWRILAYYRMHFVISGTAVFRTQNAEYRLKQGDVFSVFRPFLTESNREKILNITTSVSRDRARLGYSTASA